MNNSWEFKQAEHARATLMSFYMGTLASTSAIYLLSRHSQVEFLNEWIVTIYFLASLTYFRIRQLYKKVTNHTLTPNAFINNYRMHLFSIWTAWAYTSTYLFIKSEPPIQAFIAVVYAGITTASIPIHLLSKNIIYPLFCFILLPLIVGSFLTNTLFGYLISITTLVYLVTLSYTCSALYKIILNEFILSKNNKKLLGDLEEKTTTLVANAKKASLGEIAGGMAHEINNPLAYILSSLELIRIKKNISTDDLDKTINKIHTHINRISRIIKGLTYFSKQNINDNYTTENLEELIGKAISLKKDSLRSMGVSIIYKVPKHLELDCNPFDISLALINLINNSQEAVISQQRKWIKIEAEEYWSNTVMIKITDSGSGIKKEIREKIMTPFFTTKNPTHATGMGLSIALGIFKSHGGDLSLDTESSNTSFVIQIPIKKTQEQQKENQLNQVI